MNDPAVVDIVVDEVDVVVGTVVDVEYTWQDLPALLFHSIRYHGYLISNFAVPV